MTPNLKKCVCKNCDTVKRIYKPRKLSPVEIIYRIIRHIRSDITKNKIIMFLSMEHQIDTQYGRYTFIQDRDKEMIEKLGVNFFTIRLLEYIQYIIMIRQLNQISKKKINFVHFHFLQRLDNLSIDDIRTILDQNEVNKYNIYTDKSEIEIRKSLISLTLQNRLFNENKMVNIMNEYEKKQKIFGIDELPIDSPMGKTMEDVNMAICLMASELQITLTVTETYINERDKQLKETKSFDPNKMIDKYINLNYLRYLYAFEQIVRLQFGIKLL